jgi:hypothetical protein
MVDHRVLDLTMFSRVFLRDDRTFMGIFDESI